VYFFSARGKRKEVGRGGAANIHQLPDVCWLLIFKPTTNKSSFLYISLRIFFYLFLPFGTRKREKKKTKRK
jgi:hypothetical protein